MRSFPYLVLALLITLSGCTQQQPSASVVRPASASEEAKETDPLMKNLLKLPREQRRAWVAEHHDDIGKKGPGFISKLRKYVPAE